MTVPTTDVQNAWRLHLIEVEFAKNYKTAGMLGRVGPPVPNPILETLLPSLLFLRLGSLIDEALVEYLDMNGIPALPKPYKNDFNGRIGYLNDQGKLHDAAKLHAIRKRRNELAHQSAKSCNWQELDGAINDAAAELEHIGMVGPRPVYEFYAIREAARDGAAGRIEQDFHYGLKLGDTVVADVKWTQRYGD